MTNEQTSILAKTSEQGFNLLSAELADVSVELRKIREKLQEGIDTYEQN